MHVFQNLEVMFMYNCLSFTYKNEEELDHNDMICIMDNMTGLDTLRYTMMIFP